MRGARKGSMQLSIEAIIILVIAMVLLGLGIAFIRGFFGTGTAKLLEPFDAIEFGCDPNPNNPITTSPASISVKSGDQLQLKICVYATQEADDALVGVESCTDTAVTGKKPQMLAQAQSVKRTEIGGFGTILTAKDETGASLTPATYICTIAAIKGTTNNQFVITGDNVIARKQVTIAVT